MTNSRDLIVRTQQGGTVSILPSAVKMKIEELTGVKTLAADKQSRSIVSEEKHFIHYQRRIDILNEGVNLILETDERFQKLSPKDKASVREKLKSIETTQLGRLNELKKADEIAQRSKLDKLEKNKPATPMGIGDFENKAETTHEQEKKKIEADPGNIADYQEVLVDYLHETEKALQKFMPKKEFSHALSRAEEYALLQKGRGALCTVTDTQTRTKEGARIFRIQIEVPQDPLSEKMKAEFWKIAQYGNNVNVQETMPFWFTVMPPREKKLLLKTLEGAKSVEDISEKIQSISSKLRSIPGLANFSKHTAITMDANGTELSRVTRLRSSMVSSRDIQKREKKLTGGFLKNLVRSKKSKELKEKFAQLREEMTRHNIEQVIDTLKTEQIKAISELKNTDNNTDILSGKLDVIIVPVLMQTLITPANFMGPDKGLLQDKDAVITKLKQEYQEKKPDTVTINGKQFQIQYEIISTNHPLNPWRFITPTGQMAKQPTLKPEEKAINNKVEEGNVAEDRHLMTLARNYATRYGDDRLNQVAEAIEKTLGLPSTTDDRELYLSALEELAVSLMHGISYGSCVSGKDRKGIETMYADAMYEYFKLEKSIPPTADVKDEGEILARKKFVTLFTDIYMTRHQHENAGQNAPGADGLKTPEGYLPKDIQDAVREASHHDRVHKTSDILATNNEPHKTKPQGKPTKRKTETATLENKTIPRDRKKSSDSAILSTLQTGELPEIKELNTPTVEEQDLINRIRKILPKNHSRIKNATGINQLISAIEKGNATLQDLKTICENRPSNSKKRTLHDKKIYDMIKELAVDPALGSPAEAKLVEREILAHIKESLSIHQKHSPNENVKALIKDINDYSSLVILSTRCNQMAKSDPTNSAIYEKIISLEKASVSLSNANRNNDNYGKIESTDNLSKLRTELQEHCSKKPARTAASEPEASRRPSTY